MLTEKTPKTPTLFTCEKCDFISSKKSEWGRHLATRKHNSLTLLTEKNAQKTPFFLTCEKCDFSSSKKSEWERHLTTRKHNSLTENAQKTPKTPKTPKHVCGNCEKAYNTREGLWYHFKKCQYTLELSATDTKICVPVSTEDVNVLTSLVMELMKSNSELQKQLVDVCKHSNNKNNNTTNNHIQTNSHNKTFNLQFFLNEQCKDAMNMSDFVNTIELQLADLESVGDLGYVEGISKIIVERLNSMDIYKRPMHCSDAKRETLYIKDEDRWEKEEKHNPKLRKAIQTVSFKNMKLVNTWSDTYPESKNSESRMNDRYMKLIKQSTGGNGETADNEDKIIRRIAKEIVIEK